MITRFGMKDGGDNSITKIQIINTTGKNIYNAKQMHVSSFATPRSLDEFDINVIDFSEDLLWCYKEFHPNSINGIADLVSLNNMFQNCSRSGVLFILPQNLDYKYDGTIRNGFQHYSKIYKLKDMIGKMKHILSEAYPIIQTIELVYENTDTTIEGETIPASFSFLNYQELITSDGSNKPVLIYDDYYYLTTLELNTKKRILSVLKRINLYQEKDSPPEWFSDIYMFNDNEKNELIISCNDIIAKQNSIIDEANEVLEK